MGSLKIGDKVIVTNCLNSQYTGNVGILLQFEDYGIAILCFVRLESGYFTWCDAIPYSSLMVELL